jgi:large subunit ribosomal protein L21
MVLTSPISSFHSIFLGGSKGMYAIVEIAGKQFKVSKDDTVLAPRIDAEVGKSVTFERVLLLADKGQVSVGQPVVKGAKVKAKVVGFERGKKITVFKKKRRKGYQVSRGHRQDYTRLAIEGISKAKAQKEVVEDGA